MKLFEIILKKGDEGKIIVIAQDLKRIAEIYGDAYKTKITCYNVALTKNREDEK